MRRPLAAAAAVITSVLAVTGCSSSSTTSTGSSTSTATSTSSATNATGAASGTSPAASTASAATYPVTIGGVTIKAQPQRIVSLSPSATETLFAIGAGKQVVAADEFSTYPSDAPTTKLSGFKPNVEAIAAYKPDLVVAAGDAEGLVAGMTKLGVPVLISAAPATIEAGYGTVADLGLAVGHIDETAALVSTMRSEVAAALAKAPKDAKIRIYHELDKTYYSASSYGFIGSIYQQMGAVNIADAADKDKTGFPQLTEEAIIKADPQLIVITDQVGYTAADVAKRPGWANIAAVKNNAIVTVNADIASRWGPRLPQFITAVADAMTKAAVPVG